MQIYLTALMPVLLILFVLLSRILISYRTAGKGWQTLAGEYASPDIPEEGTDLRFASMKVGKGYYKNCVHIRYNEKGMHLRLLSIYRMFHTPLFIPWKAVGYDRQTNPISFNRHILEIRAIRNIPVTLNDNVFSSLRPYILKDTSV